MKKKIKKYICLIMCIVLISVNTVPSYSADSSLAYDPGLFSLYGMVTAIAVATGIIGANVKDSANQLVDNVVQQIKYNEVLKATSDNTYNSPYRVIGSNGQPEKPNNNNKNGKWFALVGASALGSAVMFEKGAVKDIADTFNNLNAYKPISGSTGIVSADNFKTQSTSSQIALQLANISNSAVTQFDSFLHSDWWANKDFTPNDCWFNVSVNVLDIFNNSPKYPRLNIRIFLKNDNIKYLDVANALGYYTYTNSFGSLSYYYVQNTSAQPRFLNIDHVTVETKLYRVQVASRLDSEALNVSTTLNNSSVSLMNLGTSTYNTEAYCGYKWQHENPWKFTQNVYNAGDTIINQYPQWDNDSINLLGQQIDALRIGIQNLNDPWGSTQTQIQEAPVPEPVISQLLNNWLNPENAPDPNPNPDPNPDPDPDPEPAPNPIPESVVQEGAQSLFDWVTATLSLPDGFFDKIPFSIPYDIYLLFRSMFPTNNRRTMLMVSNVRSSSGTQITDPSHLTISSSFDAAGLNTKVYSENVWVKTAPIINLDLHFTYHWVDGSTKTLDIVKTVDLKPYSYFAMLVYIFVYIEWLFGILSFIGKSFT